MTFMSSLDFFSSLTIISNRFPFRSPILPHILIVQARTQGGHRCIFTPWRWRSGIKSEPIEIRNSLQYNLIKINISNTIDKLMFLTNINNLFHMINWKDGSYMNNLF